MVSLLRLAQLGVDGQVIIEHHAVFHNWVFLLTRDLRLQVTQQILELRNAVILYPVYLSRFSSQFLLELFLFFPLLLLLSILVNVLSFLKLKLELLDFCLERENLSFSHVFLVSFGQKGLHGVLEVHDDTLLLLNNLIEFNVVLFHFLNFLQFLLLMNLDLLQSSELFQLLTDYRHLVSALVDFLPKRRVFVEKLLVL